MADLATYLADVKKYSSNANEAAVGGIVKYLGIALRNPDSSLVAGTDPAETKRVRVVGFNWKDEPDDARRWLDQFGNPYWVVIADIEGKSAIDWGIYGAPETFLVDANGTIRWKHVGPLTDALIEGELMPALDAIDPQGKQ